MVAVFSIAATFLSTTPSPGFGMLSGFWAAWSPTLPLPSEGVGNNDISLWRCKKIGQMRTGKFKQVAQLLQGMLEGKSRCQNLNG